MRPRDLLWLLGFSVASSAPTLSWAQQTPKVYRIATVSPSVPVTEMTETGAQHSYRAFLGELRRLGYVEGQNLIVERFSAEGHPERFPEIVGEVVRRRPDAVLAIGSVLPEFKAQTATIPIVGYSTDPVALGIVRSLARPGGNITGVSIDGGLETWGKSLGLLKEAIPKLSRVGLLVMSAPESQPVATILKEAADKIGISIVGSPLDGPVDEMAYRRAFAEMVQEGAEAVYVTTGTAAFFVDRRAIVELVEKHGLPAIYPYRDYVEIGGLMAYVADVPDIFVHAADAIAEILKGTKPGDIPFYQPSKFHLVVNLKTAKSLGLDLSPNLLAQADEVIE
jgi:putative ABC transport system substrate-binding protein